MHEHMYCVAIDCVLMRYVYCLDDLCCLSIDHDTLCIIARNDGVISSYTNYHYLVARYICIEAKFVFVSVILC